MTEPIIACEYVTLAYGREVVLRDVCLDIPPGIFLPFVGPNGAGKTTLLRAIIGLLKPRAGRIRTPFDRQVAGYVPQHKAIDPIYPVSVRSIVSMGLYPELSWWRRATRQQRERIERALEMFALTAHADKTFDRLSGGMKQKTMLARAFVTDAEVLVMDEPTSELDAAAEHALLERLHHLTTAHGKTVLFAHHGLNHMTRWSDRIVLVERGRAEMVAASDLPHRAGWMAELLESGG